MRLAIKKRIDYYWGGLAILLAGPLVRLAGRLLGRDHSPEPRGRILVQKILGGGSLVIAYPALLGLRRARPGVSIELLCAGGVAPFAGSLGVFDRIHVLDDRSAGRLLKSGLRAWWRALGTDTVVDLEPYSRLSTLFSLATLARNRVGFYLEDAFWRKGLQTHLVFFNRFSGRWHFYEEALALLGAAPVSREDCRARLAETLGLEAPSAARALRMIAVGHGCSDLAPERRLEADQWAGVIRSRIRPDEDVEMVFLGAPADDFPAQAIIAEVRRDRPRIRFRNLCDGRSLAESLRELWIADEFWGIDSSLIHYARIFGKKCLSFWGPTDPDTLLKPFAGLEEERAYRRIPCSPCIHVTETPPCGGENHCIRNLFSGEEPRWTGHLGRPGGRANRAAAGI